MAASTARRERGARARTRARRCVRRGARAGRPAAISPPVLPRPRPASRTARSFWDRAPRRQPAGTARPILSRGTSYRGRTRSIFIPFFVDVVLILVVVVVQVVLILVIGFGPAFRLLDPLAVHLLPGLQVEFLDVAIEVLDLYELRVLVDRQHPERFFFFDVFVPLGGHGLVISAHRESHPCHHFAAR